MTMELGSITNSRIGTASADQNNPAAKDLKRLQETDRAVKAHEQAHLSAAGNLAGGGAKFTNERGPDGQAYAVGGEVPIQIQKGRTPEETLRKANQAERAALAPADPSPQDMKVAGEARKMAQEARAESQKSKPPGKSWPVGQKLDILA